MRTIITDNFSRDGVRITFDPEVNFDLFDKDMGWVNAADFSSVWFRMKPYVPLPSWGPFERGVADFAQAEWRAALRSLETLATIPRWVNPLDVQRSLRKPSQLALAMACGLRVPKTIITNSSAEALNFLGACPRIIYKTLEATGFHDHSAILTTEIDHDIISSNQAEIAQAPGIFQEFIEKEYELRVTLVGSEVFTSRINTPQHGKASVDWRHAHCEPIFGLGSLDPYVARCLLEFHAKAGLVYGAYDLIVTPNGETVFLEVNPAGQYLWMEHQLGLPISGAIASYLAGSG